MEIEINSSCKDIWVIEECRNPSTDYYILPALKIIGFEDRIRIFNNPPQEELKSDLTVIFVRYLTYDWVSYIKKHSHRIKKIIYFMDDDILDFKAWKGLPLKYQKKLFLKAYIWKKWLLSVGADFFVSNEYLLNKYHYLKPSILPPYPIFNYPQPNSNGASQHVSLFYHGTSSHRRELNWLYDVVKEVISFNKNIVFEIIGDDQVYKKFKKLQRVIVSHPMRWEAYKYFLLTKKRHIGLVPILYSNFNLARSYTKFFEVTACGAVGIYSKDSIYREIVSHEEDGVLLPNDKKEWVNIIKKLVDNEAYRLKLYLYTQNKLKFFRESSEKNYKETLKRRLE